MKRSKFSLTQIARILKAIEAGKNSRAIIPETGKIIRLFGTPVYYPRSTEINTNSCLFLVGMLPFISVNVLF